MLVIPTALYGIWTCNCHRRLNNQTGDVDIVQFLVYLREKLVVSNKQTNRYGIRQTLNSFAKLNGSEIVLK